MSDIVGFTGSGSNIGSVYHTSKKCPHYPSNPIPRKEPFIEFHNLRMCPYCSGHKSQKPKMKLSDSDVRTIRLIDHRMAMNKEEIARRFDVTPGYIGKIIRGEARTNL